MNLEQTLMEVGLDCNQARVYLALLELGVSTVQPIAKKAGVKRTYCYDILASLQKQGLVGFVEQNGRRRYSATNPRFLFQITQLKLQHIGEVLPELQAINNKGAGKPRVSYYEGVEGLVAVYAQLATTSSLDSIGSPQHIEKYLGDYFQHKQTIPAKAKIRDLVASRGQLGWYHKFYVKPHQEYRFLPTKTKLSTDMLIFGNKLALVSYQEQPHVIVIEDSGIVEAHKAMFEIIWQLAKNR